MTDIKNTILLYFKGFLFLAIVICSSIILFFMFPSWQSAVLIALIIWASARAYYFMFYVIEKYVDSNYKFSGVFSFIKYMISYRAKEN